MPVLQTAFGRKSVVMYYIVGRMETSPGGDLCTHAYTGFCVITAPTMRKEPRDAVCVRLRVPLFATGFVDSILATVDAHVRNGRWGAGGCFYRENRRKSSFLTSRGVWFYRRSSFEDSRRSWTCPVLSVEIRRFVVVTNSKIRRRRSVAP